jgi:hypothetical protein
MRDCYDISEPVLAGIPQLFTLTLNTGSMEIEQQSELCLKPSDLLTLKGQEVINGVIKLPQCKAKQEVTFDLELYCDLPTDSAPDKILHCEVRIIIAPLSIQ